MANGDLEDIVKSTLESLEEDYEDADNLADLMAQKERLQAQLEQAALGKVADLGAPLAQDEKEYLLRLKERIELLFDALKDSKEPKRVDLVINFLEFLLAHTHERLKKLS